MVKKSHIISLLMVFTITSIIAEPPVKRRKATVKKVTTTSVGEISSAANIIDLQKVSRSFDKLIKEKEYIVLDFTATWCGPCQNLGKLLPSIAQKLPKVTFIKVDADAFRDIRGRYAVNCFPTLILLKDRKEVHRISGFGGSTTREKIIKDIKEHFQLS